MKKIALLCALLISNFISADILLHVGNLLDPENGEISKAVTIRVTDNKISEITKGYATPKKNDEVIPERILCSAWVYGYACPSCTRICPKSRAGIQD